jgi:hypothetical protein
MKRLISAFCLLIIIVPAAYSCTCDIYSHSRDFRNAKAIFIGKVISVSLNESNDEEVRKIAPYKIKLKVEKSWKGSGSEITVISDNGGPACGGFQFYEGERYLVYAFEKEMYAWSARSRSRPISRDTEITRKELSQLNSSWFRFKSRFWRF